MDIPRHLITLTPTRLAQSPLFLCYTKNEKSKYTNVFFCFRFATNLDTANYCFRRVLAELCKHTNAQLR